MRFFSAFPNDNLCCAAHASIWYFLRSNIFHVCHLNVLKSLFFSLIETLRHLTRFFGHFWNRWMPLNQRLCTWTGCYERHKIAFREQVSSRLLLYFINSWMSHQLQLLDLGVRWADWLVRQAEYLNGLRLLQWWRLGNIFFYFWFLQNFSFNLYKKIYKLEFNWITISLTTRILVWSITAIFLPVTEQAALDAVSVTAGEEAVLAQRLIRDQQRLHLTLLIFGLAIFHSIFPVASLLFDIKIQTGWTANGLQTLKRIDEKSEITCKSVSKAKERKKFLFDFSWWSSCCFQKPLTALQAATN